MRVILALALFVSAPAVAHAAPAVVSTVINCAGKGSAEGFPVAHLAIERILTINISGTNAEAFFNTYNEMTAFCPINATCQVAVSGEAIEVVARKIPNRDPFYEQTLTLDRTKWTFHAGGGGLDGGWSVTGACKAP